MKKIGSIIQDVRKSNKYTQEQLATEINMYTRTSIKKNAVSNWEANLALPNAEQFLAVCKVLGITDIYDLFIGGLQKDNPLSMLNEKGQAKVLDYIADLARISEYKVDLTQTVIPVQRQIKLFLLPASAGTGDFLDSDDYEMISVGEEVPKNADFGIRIHGDSMEPQFVNNQVVWVQQTKELYTGEIGIFYQDGMAYCKKLLNDHGEKFLLSLNPAYNPIPINETLQIFGRVVG